MVGGQQVALHLKHVLRVAQVAHQVARNGRDGLDATGVDFLPRAQDRVLIVPAEQAHRAVVGVDDGLDGVTHVVDLVCLDVLANLGGARVHGGVRECLVLSVGIVVRGRVRVDDPHEALGGRGVTVHVDDRRVGGLFECQVGGDLSDALERITVVEDLRGLVRLRGEEQVRGAELDRVQEFVPHIAHGGAAVADESRGDLAAHRGVVRVVEFLRLSAFGGSDNRVVGRAGAEVDALLIVAHLADRGHGLLPVGGQAVAGQLVTVGGDRAVAVRVDGVLVDPGLLLGGQAREVEFAHRDNGVAALATDVVAVDLHPGVEAVVQARLLELLDGLRNDLRVEQTHLGGQRFVIELSRRGRGGRVVVGLIIDVVEAVGGQGGVDVALDVGRLEAALVGAHAELLDEGGVRARQDEGGNDRHGDTGGGQAPRALKGSDHEEECNEAGDDGQNRVSGQGRVDVGVHGAVDGTRVRGE